MDSWPQIPDDVVAWFRDVFARANRRVCERLVNIPNVRETSLDDGLIEALIPESAPRMLSSGAIVRMEAHNIGGLRRLKRWETADIAVLVFVFRGNKLIAKKIGLLQSKRLYPDNRDVDDEDEVGFLYGMNAFLRRGGQQAAAALYRDYSFNEDCIYGAVHAGDAQIGHIDDLNQDFGKAIYYLLYNPHQMPFSVSYPIRQRIQVNETPVGCRVLDADQVHTALTRLDKGVSPTYAMLKQAGLASDWPLETWAADLLLTCQVGEQFADDRRVHSFLERRSGPIGAALAVSITLPDEVER